MPERRPDSPPPRDPQQIIDEQARQIEAPAGFTTTMLQLTSKQLRQITLIEQESFQRYARGLEQSPESLSRDLLTKARENLRAWVDAGEKQTPGTRARFEAGARRILAADDYLTMVRLAGKDDVERRRKDIVSHVDMLPIDWRYIEALSAGLDLKIRKDDRPRWCAELLEGTPTVRLFELDFNAFATVHARLGNRPCICMYDHLMFACYWVLEFLYAYVFRDRDPAAQGFRIPSGEKLRERGRQPAFVDECVNYLKLLYRRKSPAFVPEGGTRFSRVSPQVFWHFSAAVAGACDFVWHHECAHLLMGHLEIGPCHQVEFEADDFAWSVIRATNYNGPALSPWYRIGAVSMLTLIAVLDLIAGSDSATHPPGTARLSRIFARLTPADGLDAFVVNRAILILCEGPVESAFGIRYRVDEARRP